jgi:anti-sigma factor RsiW
MVHKPYHTWMNQLLDGELAPPDRRHLEDHLADCLDCGAVWAALNNADRLLRAAPMAAPRPGFAGRFNARRAQQRSRPRLLWGAAALGLGAVASAAVVLPAALGLLLSLVSAAQQPATVLALTASANAGVESANTILAALYIVGRAVLTGSLAQPLAWAGAVVAVLLTVVWLLVMRRLVPEGTRR